MKYLMLLLLMFYSLSAFSSDSAYQLIKHSSSFKCYFPKSTFSIWQDKGYKIKTGNGFGENLIYFDSINHQNNSARMIGNLGSIDVRSFLTVESLTMIEVTPTGNFIMTTLFPYEVENKKLLAVMSRHIGSLIDESPIFSQNYGLCEPWG